MSWLWGAASNPQYEELVEKACSPLNLTYPQSEDISVNLEITDMIRSKAVQPKPAMQSLKRRVTSKNGRVQMYALSLVDTCIKNGGDHFLAEIASKEFVDEMSGVIRSPLTGAEVKQMAMRMFQQWALAFRSKRELAFFVDVYNELKGSGVAFPPPPTDTSAHLLSTTTAPAWIDSDVCMRCRSAFTFTNRKHHCRNCGLVFDQACSSRQMPLPKFGITEEVRVCEGCWTKADRGTNPNGPTPAIPGRTLRSREDVDADLQRAIELSLAEPQPSGKSYIGSEPPLARETGQVEDDDEEMRLAIEASLREMDKARPSAPHGLEEPEYKPLPTFDLAPRESETILTFSNTLDQMAAYGERDLRRFPHAHVLYEQAYALGGKLQRNAEEKSTKQQMLAEMQGKLSQAVELYGNILDGQQAYDARRLQEQQQRQYQQQKYSYANQQPQYQQYQAQAYAPQAPQMNGHSSAYPAYAPQQYQPPEQSRAGPSLYPTMPTFQAHLQYSPQPNHQYQQYPHESAAPMRGPSYAAPAQAQPYDHSQQWAASSPKSGIERHSSLRAPPILAQPSGLQRHASATYGSAPQAAEPQGYTVDPRQPEMYPTAPPVVLGGYAPPPVDMTSHPSASPTSSIYSALPSKSRPQSLTSPSHMAAAPLPTSPTAFQPQLLQQHQHHQFQPGQWEQAQGPSQVQNTQSASQPAFAPSNVYNASSFPQAPAAVFPDAPVDAPQGLERQEREEALLIEL